jgi:hypothetical protein
MYIEQVLTIDNMKTIMRIPVRMKSMIVSSIIFTLTACGTNKQVSRVDDKEKVVQPFSSAEFRSDDNYLRYVASEESSDLSAAKSLAFIQSQTGLVMQASKEVEGMYSNYLNFSKGAQSKDAVKHIQSLFDGIVQIRLPRTTIIGEEVYRDKKTGKYTYYVASQISISDLEKESLRLAGEEAALKEVIDEKAYRNFMEQKLREKRASR